MKPITIAVEALSRQDSNLLTAEGISKFSFKALNDNNSIISNSLLEEIKLQIFKRRDIALLSLAHFLHDPSCLSGNNNNDEENVFLS